MILTSATHNNMIIIRKETSLQKGEKKIKTNLEDCLSGDVRRWFLLKQEELGRRRARMRRKRLPIVVRIKKHQSI